MKTMHTAPEPILKAALMTLHWATVCARNWTLHADVPVKMVNELMEAIHEVPTILMHWHGDDSLKELMNHLSCFHEQFWKQQVDTELFFITNLASVFQDRLRHAGYEGTLNW